MGNRFLESIGPGFGPPGNPVKVKKWTGGENCEKKLGGLGKLKVIDERPHLQARAKKPGRKPKFSQGKNYPQKLFSENQFGGPQSR